MWTDVAVQSSQRQGIQGITQSIADEIDGQHRDQDHYHRTGIEGAPPTSCPITSATWDTAFEGLRLQGTSGTGRDGGYVATCPSLPGCYSQGDTVDGALDNIREAIELCLEDMQAHGEAIPDPSRVLVGSVVVTR